MTNWYENPELHAEDYEELLELLQELAEEEGEGEEKMMEKFDLIVYLMENGVLPQTSVDEAAARYTMADLVAALQEFTDE